MQNSFLPPLSKRSKQFATLNGSGHRGRMRTRLLEKGEDSLEEYELLEMLLYLIIPRKDTKPLAKHLINSFGSLDQLFSLSEEELKKSNISQELIELIKVLIQIKDRLIIPDFHNRPCMKRWKDVLFYLNKQQLKVETENKNILRLLFLNNQQQLICDEYIVYQGRESIPVIIQKALTVYAINLISICYTSKNKISIEVQQNEVNFALALQHSARSFDLNVGDHIICFNSEYFSTFKKAKIF